MEDQLTTNCKLFDRSFALHNRKCGGWDGCVRLKPMPLLPLPLLWARIINEKYFMSRLLNCRSRGLQASCAVVTLRALRDETKTAALETIEGRPQNKLDHKLSYLQFDRHFRGPSLHCVLSYRGTEHWSRCHSSSFVNCRISQSPGSKKTSLCLNYSYRDHQCP